MTEPKDQTVKPGDSMLAAISREMVLTMKNAFGRGPSEAKSYMVDDLLFVVMRGGTTEAERMLVEAGEEDTVRNFRQCFENMMTSRMIETIERLTERRVLTYQSQITFDPDVVVEFFVFDKPGKTEHQHETARALLAS